MRRHYLPSIIILAALLAGAPAMAAFQLVLNDGRILTGADLEREPGKYILIMKDGRRLTIETDQVAEMRILGDDVVTEDTPVPADEAADGEKEEPPVGDVVAGGDLSDRVTRGEPTTVGGMAPAANASSDSEKPAPKAEILAGSDPDRPLAPGEWRPESDWPAKDPDWPKDEWVSKGPDRSWTPKSDFAKDPKANEFNPSTWSKPAKDPTWRPTDGFNKTNTMFRVKKDASGAAAKSGVATAGKPPVPGTVGSQAPGMAEGDAAWYGESFRGRATASGRPFDPDQLTAAHASLPFGTLVMVTRRDDPARSVVVEINDRGAGDRLLNLSQGAAEALDMVKVGVAPVRMEPLPAAEEPAPAGITPQAEKPEDAEDSGDQEKAAAPPAEDPSV